MSGRGPDLASAAARVAPIVLGGIGIAAALWFGFVPFVFWVYRVPKPPAPDALALIALSIVANAVVLFAVLRSGGTGRRSRTR